MISDDGIEEASPGDWMESLLRSPIFQNLPPVYLQQILINLHDVRYKPGDVIIEQGEVGEHFYLIRSGWCTLTRKASERSKAVRLLDLGENETFGEDALLSGEPRSVTITASSDMLLSRIAKEHFIKLIKTPALKYIEYAELAGEQNNGAIVLDIRDASDYEKGHIAGSQNIPFFSLRLHGKELKAQDKKVIVVCKDGALSEAAAFVLLKNKVEVQILSKGMQCLGESDEVTNAQEVPVVKEESAEDLLKKENIALKEEVARLNEKLIMLAKQNRILIKQTDKLKAVLDRRI